MKHKIFLLVILPLFFSCSRNLVYFSDYAEGDIYTEKISSEAKEVIIQPGDLLSISVTSLNPEADLPFNRSTVMNTLGNSNNAVGTAEGYLVNSDGTIDFPQLGSIDVKGLTKPELKSKLTDTLKKYLSNAIVNIRYLNYRITVIGEVNNPSTFSVPAEKISIIEALGMAGDMTVYGKRDNVLVINETEGVRRIVRLNLNNKEVLNSPHYYLQPNDVVYVEPVNSKKEQASMTRNNIALVLSVISTASLILLNLN
ncbi:polysaccharide biosynthesis/export family protein [Salegentibacter sp. F188]|uniref:Polysaccharide biosynthesis/export family protein n=1 Tax=Autumnicola patrickiae TaxID=3075591 RepID=A0ABU3DYN8_9FLAO|nr:polysaccharide biosynthesis/export family protein [Salegentibacter sp. F188]MDT0688839.1 polysaccharide biosynthesis/export family protein [Salegentibacter sp. F188]